MSKILSREEVDWAFQQYKDNKDITQKILSERLGVCERTVWKKFSKYYETELKEISKIKSAKHSEKISDENIILAFEEYKGGKTILEIAPKFGIKRESLRARFRKKFGEEYTKITKETHIGNENIWKKISHKKINELFEDYKSNKVTLKELAHNLDLAESSLTQRFNNHFKEEYKEVAKSRRDERKVTKEKYEKAFELYEKTPVSLTELANSLGIRISSLRPRFIRLFGKRYNIVATRKLNSNFLTNRGKIAEKLALEYLKIIGMKAEDVRKKCLIKNSLKRPDFIVMENFIEVKSYFIKYTNKRLKGYKEILDSYLNKELIDGTILRNGIIISLSGFSNNVWKQALKEDITLVDYKDLLRRFKENNREDLIKLMKNNFLVSN